MLSSFHWTPFAKWVKRPHPVVQIQNNNLLYSICCKFITLLTHSHLTYGQKELLGSQVHILLPIFSFADVNPSTWNLATHIVFNSNSCCGCFMPIPLISFHGITEAKIIIICFTRVEEGEEMKIKWTTRSRNVYVKIKYHNLSGIFYLPL